ncbi:MAG: phenazine biosynthesis protein PhzF [Alteromonas sp.]|jgi:PhzF family phenazine biosynthesis protein|uniref:PhzF family phenazine biosynthesis protein n=1 Tax=Alteromonas sp. MB-3u-76 TaxID=2058133 RepID=UPI000C30224D|nr:PhzF family phenazine biosynthesis protein [Alteromonas sp. MB-3u-76]AUC88477.1 phenazine biosynthesis protein PhzF [Alteromonas sp. MB-3u-76]MAI65739.1 phenazine biosynthesis protein PhzF [Alteromonas sp.]
MDKNRVKKIKVFLVNAFTKNNGGGNPAGVVLNADGLTYDEKLAIAKAVGYSETAFVSKIVNSKSSSGATRRSAVENANTDVDMDAEVSFFTVTDEVDFCGHATLAAFSTLFHQGVFQPGSYVQKTKAGLLGVSIMSNGHVEMKQKAPEFIGELTCEAISDVICIAPQVLAQTELPIEIVCTGLPDIIVPVPMGYLDKIQLDSTKTIEFCKAHNAVGIHAFELCESDNTITASCRNFAPLLGITEESATGSASGALACYLAKHYIGHSAVSRTGNSTGQRNTHSQHSALGKKGTDSAITFNFEFEQGRAMNCPSAITATVVTATNNGLSSSSHGWTVSVGGYASQFGEKTVAL